MLVFSLPGLVKLLPALPHKWVKGSANGLACRGGIVIDQAWDMSAGWMQVNLRALEDQIVRLVAPKAMRAVKVNDREYPGFHGQTVDGIELEKGKDYQIKISLY